MPDGETMQALVAGLIAGAACSFATTTILLIALSRDPRWLGRAPNLHVPLPLLGVVIVNGMMLGWTALGLVLGALYLGTADGDADGGSDLLFGVVVSGAIVVVLGAGSYIRGRVTWPMLATALSAMLSFAVVLPLLAA
ncbi:MAG TPA: hypothetical protein QF624_09860 [Dehalococcoidia bacterium]|nr:hypothetical protein [Dehalococcoidia bacterium]